MRLEATDLLELKPIIVEIVREVISQLPESRPLEIYTEREAAELLKLAPHQLRDERLRKRIECSKGPRNSPRYSRANLEKYLAERN